MKRDSLSRQAPLPPALLRLAAVLMDIAKSEAHPPKPGETDVQHDKEAHCKENRLGGPAKSGTAGT